MPPFKSPCVPRRREVGGRARETAPRAPAAVRTWLTAPPWSLPGSREREGVEVVRGNPDMVAAVADSLDFERKYTSAAIAWGREDEPTEEQIEAVLDKFEKTVWAGLERPPNGPQPQHRAPRLAEDVRPAARRLQPRARLEPPGRPGPRKGAPAGPSGLHRGVAAQGRARTRGGPAHAKNRRLNNGKVRQRLLASLGRLDRLQDSGLLDRLAASAARHSRRSAVLSPHNRGPGAECRVLGPALVFERLWQSSGCRDTLAAALAPRRFRFDLERAVFATVLHRLFSPGSDRSASQWLADQAVDGVADLRLQHLYRAMAWLGEELPRPESEDDSSCGAAAAKPGKGSPPTTRCVKDRLEEHLFRRRRNLFSGLDPVFFDTTSHYLHGAGGSQLGRRGKSKDFRPQCPQLVVGLALSGDGRPLCSEIWPGNTADVTTLLLVGKRLRERFELAPPAWWRIGA